MTDMLSSICAKIALIGADISGINQSGVFDPPPANLNTADLPALFVWTGTASHDESILGENFVDTTRRFYLQVAVIPLGQGDPNTRETLVRPLLDSALTVFRQHTSLKGLEFVENVSVGSDSGVIILPEYGGKFIGFEIPIDVKYFALRDHAPNE